MQPVYSTTSSSGRAIGLFLLRAGVGTTLLAQGLAYFCQTRDVRLSAWAVCGLAMVAGCSLLLGFLTPVGGALTALLSAGMTYSRLPVPNGMFTGNPLSFSVIAMAVALIFLGPGAYSLDSLLFGRRRVIIPRSSSLPNS